MREILVQFYPSAVGTLFLAECEAGPVAVCFTDGEAVTSGSEREYHYLETRYPGVSIRQGPCLELSTKLDTYFGGLPVSVEIGDFVAGAAFERAVWREIARIGWGETVAYGEIARRLGSSGAAQAVGAAAGSNPLPIVVPCHRVVGAHGDLVGFGGGLKRKRWLLDHERPTLFDNVPL